MKATVWIPATPLPHLGDFSVECNECRRRFRSLRDRSRLVRYERHWHAAHAPRLNAAGSGWVGDTGMSMEISPEGAVALGYTVEAWGDGYRVTASPSRAE